MIKRIFSVILTVAILLTLLPIPPAHGAEPDTAEIANEYVRVSVNRENGGYVITTVEGDIMKKSDDNVALTHRGANMDTSFTSLRIGSEDFVFGNRYGFLGYSSTDVVTVVDPAGNWVTSTWSVKDIEVEQKITLVNSSASEQLGTAMLTYTVRNKGQAPADIQSRMLIDTQLGDRDYGYYEIPKQNLGQGYETFMFEQTWDSKADPTIRMPADYFVRDNPYSSSIVGYGVNSVFEDQKPYRMTFAHWANIAATRFDYEPDTTLNFTNAINGMKTADSAVALYYDLGTISAGAAKSFSTYYGVTANLKNKDNTILINTTAPSKLEFKDGGRNAYKGSEAAVGDNIVRINTTVTNPASSDKTFSRLAVVVYTLGFDTLRQTDAGNWIPYDNVEPIYTEVISFAPGENRTTYFDFKFTPDVNAQLGSFVTKVFNVDEKENELGSYAEDFCLGTTENFIILPGTSRSLPAITLASLEPKIVYNDEIRYLTISGRGMNFFRSDLLNRIELRADDGKVYEIPIDAITYEQTEYGQMPASAALQVEGYMPPGRYSLHFVWKNDTGENALQGVPADFTSSAMFVQMSSDPMYRNDTYSVVTVQRDNNNKYKVVPYKNESAFSAAGISEDNLLLSLRGELQQDKNNKNFYRLMGNNKDVNISYMLNYHGSDLTVEQKADGSIEVLMDGKVTTVGANTTVRNGTAAFKLKAGTEYIVPVYDERGEIQSGDSLVSGQDYIELKWDNAFDTLRTIGGFLIDLKYGVLGKIQNADGKTYDIISFGGGLDLSFMTPGAAATARKNKNAATNWQLKDDEYQDDDPDGFGFGLEFDEETGEYKTQTNEADIPPKSKKASAIEGGATIHDVLYGGKDPGYLGINMDAHITLPQIVSFLPSKIEGRLGINTIGGYQVEVDGMVRTATLEMSLSLVIKSNPSGAPIPDKLYFTLGGIEPGLNVDGAGVLWVTGGGGGFDKLYDTIYGKDGVPPLTLLLHIEFDITKIMTGSADLSLSLRGISISFDDISLKKVRDAKFLDGGLAAIGWYPNFSLKLQAGVTYAQILSGSFQISAAAGGDTKAFFEFVLNVAITLPKFIPVVGGMQLASAELGGGTEKVWGSITLLDTIKVGFIYYWGGDLEFTHGNAAGTETFASLSSDAGIQRSFALFQAVSQPKEVGTDKQTGEPRFISVGSNLSYVAGSVVAEDFDQKVEETAQTFARRMLRTSGAAATQIFTNEVRSSHLVQFADTANYILTISRADGTQITDTALKAAMTVKQNGNLYPLQYYTAPGADATDQEKEDALRGVNVNIAGGIAYIMLPSAVLTAGKNFLLEFGDGNGYDVGVILAEPVGELTSCDTELHGNSLTVNWTGENLSDTAKIIVSVSDIPGEDGVIVNTTDIPASYSGEKGTMVINLPDRLASGTYHVTVTLSDEGKCFEKYDAGSIAVTNAEAPDAVKSVTLANAGNDKLRVTVTPPDDETNLQGYFIDVYENGTLVDTALYFDKNAEMLIGGRYEMPVFDENGNPTGNTVTVGYTHGRKYSVKVRACNTEDPNQDIDGDEVYHCSAAVQSPEVTLIEATAPIVLIGYDKASGKAAVTSDTAITGELYVNGNIRNGQWFRFESANTTFSQLLNLPDGEHTLEFHAMDGDGDSAIVQQIVSVDTTAPALLMETPVSGGFFTGDTLTIRASSEPDAVYTFKINGVTVTPIESNIRNGSLLGCTLPLGALADMASITLEITAADPAENTTSKRIELTNSALADVCEIAITKGNTPVTDGEIHLDQGESAQLKLMGLLPEGKSLDITDSPGAEISVFGGSSASLNGTVVTAETGGRTLVTASYDLGGGRTLNDGIVVVTNDQILFDALDQAIANGKSIRKGNYTDATWNRLQEVIAEGERIRNMTGMTQEMVDSAATMIADAIAALREKDRPGSDSSENFVARYTVLFNTNGGSNVLAQSIARGSKASRPADPVRDGFIFVGWFTDKELTKAYDFTAPVAKTFTLYAKWTEKKKEQTTVPDHPPEIRNPFGDVQKTDWFFEAVQYIYGKKLMIGVSDTEFAPNSTTNRAMLAQILYRMAGTPRVIAKCPFEDVPADAWYHDAVTWAALNGIVKGVSNTRFAPYEEISREQLAVMLYRYAGYIGYSTSRTDDLSRFTDVQDISDYAVDAVKWAVAVGLINGRTSTTLVPKGTATRAEMAAILYRFLKE